MISSNVHFVPLAKTEFVRTSGFLCRRPDDMELTAETSAWSYSHHICFWTITEDNFLFKVIVYARIISVYGVDALSEFTF